MNGLNSVIIAGQHAQLAVVLKRLRNDRQQQRTLSPWITICFALDIANFRVLVKFPQKLVGRLVLDALLDCVPILFIPNTNRRFA